MLPTRRGNTIPGGGGGTRRRGVQSADGGGTKRGTLRFFAAARVPPSKKSPPCRKSAQISTKSTLVATRLHNFTIGSILRVKNAIFVPMKIRRRHFTCGGWEATSYYFLGGAAPRPTPTRRDAPPPPGATPLFLPKRHKKFKYHEKTSITNK